MDLARLRRGHNAISQRERPVRERTAPGSRHRSPGGHRGGGRRGRRGPVRGHCRLLRPHDLDPDSRRLRHLLPPPLLDRHPGGLTRLSGRPHRRGRHDGHPLGDTPAPPLRSPRRRNPPRLPRPTGLPATARAPRPGPRTATAGTGHSTPAGTTRRSPRRGTARRARAPRASTRAADCPPAPGAAGTAPSGSSWPSYAARHSRSEGSACAHGGVHGAKLASPRPISRVSWVNSRARPGVTGASPIAQRPAQAGWRGSRVRAAGVRPKHILDARFGRRSRHRMARRVHWPPARRRRARAEGRPRRGNFATARPTGAPAPCAAVKVREAIRLIEADGWRLVRIRGSHRQFRHSEKPGLVTIAGKPSADLTRATAASILRQAGLR